jgi:CRISPR-associated exonuclease Cas4
MTGHEAKTTIAISALQHFAYCPRQFALIHLEQLWRDNHFTAQGHVLHERVDSQESESRGSKRSERSVQVHSERLGLHGKLDLLEVHTQGDGSTHYVPVEYKRGKRKPMDWDRIQLCAQALCLEEMRGVAVLEGALWYWQERTREVVSFGEALRQATVQCIGAARAVLESGQTPPPTTEKKRCKACSLVDECAPDWVRSDHTSRYVRALFESNPKGSEAEGNEP